ncbi:Maf family protein [Alicyclobacillus fodiniaquatilis]|uniref:dTTP/UTP pyrophosphatase n=1 Tax=Alicyclobacillus fodiniaquatilis TaxID=1661150 RepID=A0ABW4JB39_9BACL
MTGKRLILASGSPRRRALLEMLHIPFETCVTNADESLDPTWSPHVAVEQLALKKATAAVHERAFHAAIILAADTVVSINGQIFGKPTDEQHALSMLQQLQGKQHDVFTGVCLYDVDKQIHLQTHVHTQVWMRPQDDDWLRWYIQTGEPLDKAGAYAIQGIGSLLIERIVGDYYNVVGLPLSSLDEAFISLGIPLRSLMNVSSSTPRVL